jgi:hypothetical protein
MPMPILTSGDCEEGAYCASMVRTPGESALEKKGGRDARPLREWPGPRKLVMRGQSVKM